MDSTKGIFEAKYQGFICMMRFPLATSSYISEVGVSRKFILLELVLFSKYAKGRELRVYARD